MEKLKPEGMDTSQLQLVEYAKDVSTLYRDLKK